jgi:hypothetical protein
VAENKVLPEDTNVIKLVASEIKPNSCPALAIRVKDMASLIPQFDFDALDSDKYLILNWNNRMAIIAGAGIKEWVFKSSFCFHQK